MQQLSLFTIAQGLAAPWEVTAVRFDPAAGRIDFDVAFPTGTHFASARRRATGSSRLAGQVFAVTDATDASRPDLPAELRGLIPRLAFNISRWPQVRGLPGNGGW